MEDLVSGISPETATVIDSLEFGRDWVTSGTEESKLAWLQEANKDVSSPTAVSELGMADKLDGTSDMVVHGEEAVMRTLVSPSAARVESTERTPFDFSKVDSVNRFVDVVETEL